MIRGVKVNLVAVEKEDLQDFQKWRNNPDFRKHFREYRDLSMPHQERWFEEKVLRDPSTLMFSIKESKTQELLGCAGLCYINWVHRHADLSCYIGWKNTYIDDHGYAEDSCETLFRYAFDELGLNKVWTEIYSFDAPKLRLYTQLGMKQDGLLRENYWYEGKWWDSRIMSLLASDYRARKSATS